MTRTEIIEQGKIHRGNFIFETYSKAFDKGIVQSVYIPTINWATNELEKNYDNIVTDYVTDCINSFIELEKDRFLDKLKNEIFRLFNTYIKVTEYGQVPEELIAQYGNTEANRIFFNGQSSETVFASCEFREVFYEQDSGPELRFRITAKVNWEMEHGITLFFENGELTSVE